MTDRVSAAGYAMGYLGGGLLLLLNLAWVLQPALFGFASATSAVKASFVSVAVWWALFAIPLFRHVPEPPRAASHVGESSVAIVAAFARLGHTFREIRRYRQAFILFLSMLLYQDGIQTIIRMAAVYGAEIGIDQTSQIAAFVMVQFLGIPFAFLFGSLGTRIGTKRAIFIAIAVYAVATILGYFIALDLGRGVSLRAPMLAALPGPVGRRVALAALVRAGADRRRVGSRHLDASLALAAKVGTGSLDLPCGVRASLRRGLLECRPCDSRAKS